MTRYTVLWILWIAMFFAIEVPAMVTDPEHRGTLSHLLWKIVAHPLGWYLVAGFLAWLTVHVLSRGRFA